MPAAGSSRSTAAISWWRARPVKGRRSRSCCPASNGNAARPQRRGVAGPNRRPGVHHRRYPEPPNQRVSRRLQAALSGKTGHAERPARVGRTPDAASVVPRWCSRWPRNCGSTYFVVVDGEADVRVGFSAEPRPEPRSLSRAWRSWPGRGAKRCRRIPGRWAGHRGICGRRPGSRGSAGRNCGSR